MIPKLQEYMNDKRIPFFLRKRKETIYFQMQIDVAREDGMCAGIYCEYDKTMLTDSTEVIGVKAQKMISRFHELADLSLHEFNTLTGTDMNFYKAQKEERERMKFLEVKTEKELNESFIECGIEYIISNNRYNFFLSWIYQEGRKKWCDSSDSTGKEGILTFDEPLEFDDNVAPERLGEMILEAFERSRKMAERMSGEFCPAKQIELLDETIIEVTPPKDKHFIDCDDAGVGELYQVYSYIAKEGANPSAGIMLTVAPELHEDLNCDNIHSAWIEAFGSADDLTVTETQYGIYKYRAEMTNKKMYRIAYFTSCRDGLVLECCMEVVNPSKKKKLIEKLSTLFEEFVLNCKLLN